MIRAFPTTAAANDFQTSRVVAGFMLAMPNPSGLQATISAGGLYANGAKYAPAAAPAIPACSATAATYYLWYGSGAFYWNTSGTVPTTAGDCIVGSAVVSSSAVQSVTSYQAVNTPAYAAAGGFVRLDTTVSPSGTTVAPSGGHGAYLA